MVPQRETEDDPNLRAPRDDNLNGFDPLDVFGFHVDDQTPDEHAIRARYHRLVRLVALIHPGRLPYTLADVNRARENLLHSFTHVVRTTRSYHRSTWNPMADERDLEALLQLIQPAAQDQGPSTPSRCRTRAVTISSDDTSEDDVEVLWSRSGLSSRKDPVSEYTKREMRGTAMAEQEVYLNMKAGRRVLRRSEIRLQGNEGEEEITYIASTEAIPGYVVVGNDRRRGHGAHPVVIGLDSRGHGNFFTLEPSGRSNAAFRLKRIPYDAINQSPAVLTALRQVGEIAPAHTRATREELKQYYELVVSQRQADAASEGQH